MFSDMSMMEGVGSKESSFFFGGRVSDGSGSVGARVEMNTISSMSGSGGGVGGAWPSKSKGTMKEVEKHETSKGKSVEKPPPVRPAFYVVVEQVEEVRIKIKTNRLGATLAKLVGNGGLALIGLLPSEASFIVKLEGEGAKKVTAALGFDVLEGLEAESRRFGDLPEDDESAILVGDPPGDPDLSALEDIPETHVVLVTPDSFERDFTGTDLPLGSIACSILTPFSPVDGVEYELGNEGKCKYDSTLLAAKVVKMGPRLAAKVARDVATGDDVKVMEKILGSGRCLVLLLRGRRGYGASLKRRLGPKEIQGGSLAARTFNPDCIKALYADDDRPGIAWGVGRRKNWNLVCRLFRESEVKGGDFRSLFLVELPVSLVAAVVRFKRLGLVMKRSFRAGFSCVACRAVDGGAALLLRAGNGKERWSNLLSSMDLTAEEARTVSDPGFVQSTFGSLMEVR